MNKQEFIATLHHYLAALPEEERNELLRDYEAHFIYGQQHGKTEVEIARELGDPLVLAREIVGPDFLPPPPWVAPQHDTARTIGVSIVLFFLNLFALPVFLTLWAAFVAVCASAIAGVLSPVMLVLEGVLYGGYTNFKLFISIGMVGAGMLLAALAQLLFKGLLLMTVKYFKWNNKTWKGRS
ncbi:HAAS signaling domain-containing protein [Cohnella mopanensis]|uniref:HAAS signaling domain-containing protein n=1 Tax=Cohnella mopanensis TaxID=2911966 RepID=UPI001EF809DF|nr:DUF1700 domain-containing protein [Cohnella mopanensis]